MKQLLKVPRGNPFKMHLCPQRIAPAQQDASFRDITDLSVRLTRHNWDGIDAEFDYTEDGDIIIQVPSVLKCVTYGVELTGTYNGKSWRWADCSVFRVVECNCRSNVQFEESFDVETYYIYDDIIPSYEASEEALVLNTHAHAWFEGGTLHLVATEGTDIEIIKDTLIIREYGRENIENHCGRPSREYCR